MIKKVILFDSFKELDDPRQEKHSSRHLFSDILLLTILGVICVADSWIAIERFGNSKLEWLQSILELPNGIPSHDTIGNLFSCLDPKQLQGCFLKWVNAVFDFSDGEIIAIDGKTLRHSYDIQRLIEALFTWLMLGLARIDLCLANTKLMKNLMK